MGDRWRVLASGLTLSVVIGEGEEGDQITRGVAAQRGQVITEELERQFVKRYDDGEEYARSVVKRLGDDEPDYDPSDHTVDEVQNYLEGVDDEERERVLAAERAGKDRSSLVGDGGT